MRRLVLALTAFGAALGLLAGCGSKGTLKADAPPDTRIFIQGPVDTVNHNVHLYWFGTDPDGTVKGFELRLLVATAPADTLWTYTTKYDSVFAIRTPDGYTAPTLEVRAVDDAGLRDPTPAQQLFKFSNLPPIVTLLNRHRMTDTTYAAVTLRWSASDPDGEGSKLRFFVWLDGNESNKNLVAGNSFTFPTEQFLQGGLLRTGPRQMFIQAIDDGGMLSAIDSTRWMVRAPGTGGYRANTARLLLIDDQPSTYTQDFTTDTLYYNTAARNLLPGQYSLLQLQFTNPFRSLDDMVQTFRQFDAVVWYIGGANSALTFETTLQTYQAAIGLYLASGGNLYLEGLDLIDTPHGAGPLNGSVVGDLLGSDFLFQNYNSSLADSSAAWGNTSGGKVRTAWGDTLRFANELPVASSSTGGLRAFGVRDDSYGIIWALPLPVVSLKPADVLPFQVPIAVSVPQPSGGRFVMVTFPLRSVSTPPAAYRNAHKFLAQVFQQMGLTTP